MGAGAEAMVIVRCEGSVLVAGASHGEYPSIPGTVGSAVVFKVQGEWRPKRRRSSIFIFLLNIFVVI